MLQVYLYNTANGQVLARGFYEEAGDGATTRALAAGIINPATQYAPGGVITARPTFTPALSINKSTFAADATDSVTVSNVPNGAVVKIFKDQDSLPRAALTITDGSLVLRTDTVGSYTLVFTNFPTQDATFTVQAT